MLNTYYVGLDIHKKTISFCVRQADGNILEEGILAANSQAISSGDDISVLRAQGLRHHDIFTQAGTNSETKQLR